MKALYITFHGWRGINLANSEPDLFSYVWRLGFVTVYVCKRCILDAYRRMRCTARDALGLLGRDGESR